jgi:hypothetical protein
MLRTGCTRCLSVVGLVLVSFYAGMLLDLLATFHGWRLLALRVECNVACLLACNKPFAAI